MLSPFHAMLPGSIVLPHVMVLKDLLIQLSSSFGLRRTEVKLGFSGGKAYVFELNCDSFHHIHVVLPVQSQNVYTLL